MSNIIVAGVGGQGTVLASKLIAQAALLDGKDVRTAETIGMAQRGGSVLGHVRTSPLPVIPSNARNLAGDMSTTTDVVVVSTTPLSPLVPQGSADCLIGFEPAEAVRALGYLRPGGTVVCAQQALEPVTATLQGVTYDGTAELEYLRASQQNGRLKTLVVIDGTAACAELGSTRVLNVVLLGAAFAAGALDVSEQALIAAIEALVKPKFIDLNKAALKKGMDA
jgi:indolepyruvate ferredoxin oxidoreductase beta subunit